MTASQPDLLRRLAVPVLGRRAPCSCSSLAWVFLADQPAYRTGVIIVGLARCIAMVLIWNDIARATATELRSSSSSTRSSRWLAFSLLGYFYLTVLPAGSPRHAGVRGRHLGGRPHRPHLPRHPTRRRLPDPRIGLKRKGREWYEREFIPRIGPITLYGLLFTIVLLFAIQGDKITAEPLEVAMIAVPLLVYFAVMWIAGFTSASSSASRTRRPRASPSPSPATTSS